MEESEVYRSKFFTVHDNGSDELIVSSTRYSIRITPTLNGGFYITSAGNSIVPTVRGNMVAIEIQERKVN